MVCKSLIQILCVIEQMSKTDYSTVVIYLVKGLRNQNTRKSGIKKRSMQEDIQIILEALGKQILR